MLCLPDGRVKILDFGLARFEGEARRLASVSRLTMTGLVAGTPGYMAPEQLLGLDVDARADQFALGTLIAELATGINPFEGGPLAATIARVLGSDGLPPSSHRLLPADLAAVAHRCTRQRPEDRYPSTSDVLAAIERCQRGEAPRCHGRLVGARAGLHRRPSRRHARPGHGPASGAVVVALPSGRGGRRLLADDRAGLVGAPRRGARACPGSWRAWRPRS